MSAHSNKVAKQDERRSTKTSRVSSKPTHRHISLSKAAKSTLSKTKKDNRPPKIVADDATYDNSSDHLSLTSSMQSLSQILEFVYFFLFYFLNYTRVRIFNLIQTRLQSMFFFQRLLAMKHFYYVIKQGHP